jgi:phosphohistidine phosphatase
LTERGVMQAQDAGHAMAALGVTVDTCLSSPKLRAMQTAQLVCASLGVEVTVDSRLAGEPFDAYDLVAGLGDTLLVGHDPSFTLTLHDLTGAQARMRKGGLAGIVKGELVVLMRPSELSAIAGRERVA